MRRDPDRASRHLAVALAGAFLVHAVALAVQDTLHERVWRLDLAAPAAAAPSGPPDTGDPGPAPPEVAAIAVVSLTADDLAALALAPAPGVADAAAFTGAHPRPRASADLPGARAADRGGGADGGPASWTGRRDPAGTTALRAQPWSSDAAYRTARRDVDRRAASPEAIDRAPAPAWGDRAPDRAARAGAAAPTRGDRADGVGAGRGAAAAGDDPELAASAGRTAPARREGATRPADQAPMVDAGDVAVDAARRGAAGADLAVAAASDQRHPDPYELTPPRAGGDAGGEGVRGRRAADGALADGRGAGEAASRADRPPGAGGGPVFATRTDPYLRELLRRLDGEITFPRDLKLDLRSGRVIAMITLQPDGRITDVTVATSSGFAGFDAELARALRALRSLGKVPSALLEDRSSLRVMVPYTFRNPMIR